MVVDLNFLLENDHLELLNRPYFQDLQVEDLGGHPEELADSGDEALIHGDDGVAVIEGIVQGGEVADEGACLLQSFELVFVVKVVAQFRYDVVLPNLPVVFHVQFSKAHAVDLPKGILQ